MKTETVLGLVCAAVLLLAAANCAWRGIQLDQVLMVGEGEDVKVGTPYLKGGNVTATVVDHGRRDKIKVIKFKRRKNYRKQMGHRQYFTQIEITGIDA